MALEITPDDLLARYAAGERNFAGAELDIINCRGLTSIKDADLRQINLRGATLTSIRIENTNLSEADLRGVQMIWSRLTNVDLSRADIRWAVLKYAQWLDVNLTEASLEHSNLIKTHLRANLSYTNFEDTILVHTSLKGSINIEPFRVDNALIWNLQMPDGTIEEGPRFELIEFK